MKKRFLACVLATVCAVTSAGLAVFTGCGEKENSDDEYFTKPVMPTGVELTKVDEVNFKRIFDFISEKISDPESSVIGEYYFNRSYTSMRGNENSGSRNYSSIYEQGEYKYKPAQGGSVAVGSDKYRYIEINDYERHDYETPDSEFEEFGIPRSITGNMKYDNYEEKTLKGNEVNLYHSGYFYNSDFDVEAHEQKVREEISPLRHMMQFYAVDPLMKLNSTFVNSYIRENIMFSIAFDLDTIIELDNSSRFQNAGIKLSSASVAFGGSPSLLDEGEVSWILEEAKENQWQISQSRNFDIRMNDELGIVWIDAKYEATIGDNHGEYEYIIHFDCSSEPQRIKTEVEGVNASYEGNIIPIDVKALETALLAGEEFIIQLPESYNNTVYYSLHDEDYNVDYQTHKLIEITADKKAIIPAGACQQLLDEFADLLTPGTEYYFYLLISSNQIYFIKIN